MNKSEKYAMETGTLNSTVRPHVARSTMAYASKLAMLATIKSEPALVAKHAASVRESEMMESIGVASARFISGDTSRMTRASAKSARDNRGNVNDTIQTHCGFAGYACEAYASGSADLPVAFLPLVNASTSADIERPEVQSEE